MDFGEEDEEGKVKGQEVLKVFKMFGVFLNSILGSQESSLVEYPFHWTRYL